MTHKDQINIHRNLNSNNIGIGCSDALHWHVLDLLANMQSAYQHRRTPLQLIILFKCPLLTKALFISRLLRSLDNSSLSDKGLISYQKFISYNTACRFQPIAASLTGIYIFFILNLRDNEG